MRTIELADNKIKDAGVKALTSSTFTNLHDINLNDNGITSDGIKSLKKFQAVEYLSLSGNSLND